MTLEQARAKARNWFELIDAGKDPAEVEAAAIRAAQRQRANTFAAVLEDYIAQVVVGPDAERPFLRRGRELERTLRKVLPVLGGRPITEITRRDVQELIVAVRDRGIDGAVRHLGCAVDGTVPEAPAPTAARNLLSVMKTFFTWALNVDAYGLEASPCEALKAKHLRLGGSARGRTLSDDEVFALWRATGRLGEPYCSVYRLLILTALRLREVANARISEFSFEKAIWLIPAERMKGTNQKARDHLVPLTAAMMAYLRPADGGARNERFLFSTTKGARPVHIGAKVKKRLDKRMARTLKALARLRGQDYREVKLRPWRNHDIRRTVRSGLSELRIDRDVAEAVLAHVPPGIVNTYDLYQYQFEKGAALASWGEKVRGIVERSVVRELASRVPHAALFS
jgi:integrase